MKILNENIKEKTERSIFGKAYKIVVVLAPFGFILSIIFFFVQIERQRNVINNLISIEQSVSTRHIGIFPDYLDEINELLSETSTEDTAKIIIFEDVLFYGAFYNGPAFKTMIENIMRLTSKNKRITIAYYDNSDNIRTGRMFREVVQESWMHPTDLSKLAGYRKMLMDSLQLQNNSRRNIFRIADSVASEKYFVRYRDDKGKKFEERVEKILIPLYDSTKNDYPVFSQIDQIKNKYITRPFNTISFYDMYRMCQEITDELETFFEANKITLVPLTNYLVMSCWSNGKKVLFAFPGKFAADEIGFISHDLAILHYIETMLAGVEVNLKNDSENN
jgi:hypothetical protein